MSSSNDLPRARGAIPPAIGLFSIALGAVQVAAPGRFGRLVGVGDSPRARTLVRAVGVRELAVGLALLSTDRPRPWLWGRVAGDALDAAVLLPFALRPGRGNRAAGIGAAAAVGVGVIDATAAVSALRHRRSAGSDERGGATIIPITAARSSSRRTGAGQPMQRVRTAVTINRPVEDVYRAWRDFARMPTYMHHLESVDLRDDDVSRWTVKGPLGRTVSWEAELVRDSTSAIEWRSLRGPVETRGTVRFRPAPGRRGTEVQVDVQYGAPAGAVGRMLARAVGESPVQQVDDDVRRFKQMVETGQVVRSEGSPDGTVARRQAMQRPARPAEKART